MLENPDPFLLHSAMTAVSVLTRVLPFLLEAYTDPETGEVDPALHRMFWSKKEAGAGGEGEGGEGDSTPAAVSLGSAMVSATMRLLFTRQLTVDVYSSCDAGDAGACFAVRFPWGSAVAANRMWWGVCGIFSSWCSLCSVWPSSVVSWCFDLVPRAFPCVLRLLVEVSWRTAHARQPNGVAKTMAVKEGGRRTSLGASVAPPHPQDVTQAK